MEFAPIKTKIGEIKPGSPLDKRLNADLAKELLLTGKDKTEDEEFYAKFAGSIEQPNDLWHTPGGW